MDKRPRETDPEFPGARWWKFDFHTHTPASADYGKGPRQADLWKLTPREWLLGLMRAGLDCVAVTDHNSGEWIAKLKEEIAELRASGCEGYRPLVLFPGVEISANGGVHILAIFDPSKTTEEVVRLLGAVGFQGTFGESDGVTRRSITDVIEAIHEAGGLAIPAHVDKANGLFANLRGNSLAQVLETNRILAMELVDSAYSLPQVYRDRKLCWASVLGSDAHHPSGSADERYPGSHFTWVKMGKPTLEGLRLALLDGAPLSVRRSEETEGEPNAHGRQIIESIEIAKSRYCGHERPLAIRFSPWLNAIIGGRGTGKTTVVEFLRLALRRDGELPEKLREEFKRFAQVPANRGDYGALRPETAITAAYQKDGQRFRLNWRASAEGPSIDRQADDTSFVAFQGDATELFPARLFSQRQIFELAQESAGLLGVIDAAREVGRAAWQREWEAEVARFLRLRAQEREIQAQLAGEVTLRNEIDEVRRRLAVFEETEHAAILRMYQRRARQERVLAEFSKELDAVAMRLAETREQLVVSDPPEGVFSADDAEDRAALDLIVSAREQVQRLRDDVGRLADRAKTLAEEWPKERDASTWKLALESSRQAYDELVRELHREGVADPKEYGPLLQKREAIERRLRENASLRDSLAQLHEQVEGSLANLCDLRLRLSERRAEFIERVVGHDPLVRIALREFGDARSGASSFREVLAIDPEKYRDDILSEDEEQGLIGNIYASLPEERVQRRGEILGRLEAMKQRVRRVNAGEKGAGVGSWFEKALSKLPVERVDHLDAWFPEDGLDVSYSAKGDGTDFRPIHQGSPGQRTAAILAFLLSHGDEPLVIDQPEDDLDNELIYDLVVRQLRANKVRRQVIVVTHNPNIVVNGDAELVIVMSHIKGECRVRRDGSLQEELVRDEICRVMEGGREALEQRYRRILAGRSDV